MSNDNSNAAAVEAPRRNTPERQSLSDVQQAASLNSFNDVYGLNGRSSNVTDQQQQTAETDKVMPGAVGLSGATRRVMADTPNRLGDTRESGLISMTMDFGDGVDAKYDPTKRNDRMSSFKRGTTEKDGTVTEQTFQGRQDALQSQRTVEKGNAVNIQRTYEPGKHPEGLLTENSQATRGTTDGTINRTFDPTANKDGKATETITVNGNAVQTERLTDVMMVFFPREP